MRIEEVLLRKFIESKHQSPNDWLLEIIDENLLEKKNRSAKGHLYVVAICIGFRESVNRKTYTSFNEIDFLNESCNKKHKTIISEDDKIKYLPILKEWVASLTILLKEYQHGQFFSVGELLEVLERIEKIGQTIGKDDC